MNKITVGEFEIVSGRAIISDPCYDIGTWCAGVLDKVMNGTWTAYIVTNEHGRVDKLLALTGNPYRLLAWESTAATIGVDSGQAGIFDADHFKKDEDVSSVARLGSEIVCEDEPWYSICCDRTLNTEHSAGVIPYGCVSSSGYGDGSYRCYIQKDNQGFIVGIQIDFDTDSGTED